MIMDQPTRQYLNLLKKQTSLSFATLSYSVICEDFFANAFTLNKIFNA